MGVYLTTGLAKEIIIRKGDADFGENAINGLQEQMHYHFGFDPDNYTVAEMPNRYQLSLKEEIIETEFIPFLESFYPLLYNEKQSTMEAVDALKNLPVSEWFDRYSDDLRPVFVIDEPQFGSHYTIRWRGRNLRISFSNIQLVDEGKFNIKSYGLQFDLYEYAMRETFKAFRIANALRVYIYGG